MRKYDRDDNVVMLDHYSDSLHVSNVTHDFVIFVVCSMSSREPTCPPMTNVGSVI